MALGPCAHLAAVLCCVLCVCCGAVAELVFAAKLAELIGPEGDASLVALAVTSWSETVCRVDCAAVRAEGVRAACVRGVRVPSQ